MSANIGWDKVRLFMNRARSITDESADCLPLFDGNRERDLAWLYVAYPSADALPLRWMLEGHYQGIHGFLARGNGSSRFEYVILGCPESVLECCLLRSSLVETGISMLAQQAEIVAPWAWVMFLEALQG